MFRVCLLLITWFCFTVFAEENACSMEYICKSDEDKSYTLEVSTSDPAVAFVSVLSTQKGIDIIVSIIYKDDTLSAPDEGLWVFSGDDYVVIFMNEDLLKREGATASITEVFEGNTGKIIHLKCN